MQLQRLVRTRPRRHAAFTHASRRHNDCALAFRRRARPGARIATSKEGFMRNALLAAALTTAFAVFSGSALVASADRDDDRGHGHGKNDDAIQLGPRPFYLVDG